MQLLYLKNTDIYFNLAVEEYILKEKTDDFFIIWQSDNSVVFGKHQNIFEEINLKFVLDNKINIARRITGGGTVLHDLGNINYAYITTKNEGKQIDFKQYTKPVYDYIKSLNIDIYSSKRHDLFIDNKKISGNAEHIYKNRVLHHGTLLFNSDLEKLNKALNLSKNKFESKAVKSVTSSVTNISEYINNKNINSFISNFKDYISRKFNIEKLYSLSKDEILIIENLRDEKYKTNYWLYEYSPKFEFKNTISLNNEKLKIYLSIEQGIIKKIFFSINDIENPMINNIFTNQKYNPNNIKKIISANNLNQKLKINNKDIFYAFF